MLLVFPRYFSNQFLQDMNPFVMMIPSLIWSAVAILNIDVVLVAGGASRILTVPRDWCAPLDIAPSENTISRKYYLDIYRVYEK